MCRAGSRSGKTLKSKIHTRETSNQGKAIVLLQWIALGVILVIAVMRCVVVFAPQVIFDVDPVIDSNRLAGLGMGGSLSRVPSARSP